MRQQGIIAKIGAFLLAVLLIGNPLMAFADENGEELVSAAATHELRVAKEMQYYTADLEFEYISKDSTTDTNYDIYVVEAGTTIKLTVAPVAGGSLNGNTLACYRPDTYQYVRYSGEGGVYSFEMPTYNIWILANSQAITPPPPAAPTLNSATPNSLNTVLAYSYEGLGSPFVYAFYRELGSGAEWVQSPAGSNNGSITVTLPKNGIEYELHVKAAITNVQPNVWGAESNTVTATQPFVNSSGVSLNRTAASLGIGAANATQLVPLVAPSDASDKSISWISDNEEVATVTNGLVTGVSAGTATITVTTNNGGHVATCTVTVTEEPNTPANGSMIFGIDDISYSESGAEVAETTLEVTIPTSKAITAFRFLPTVTGATLSDIKFNGQSFFGNTTGVTVEGLTLKAAGFGVNSYYTVSADDGTSYLEAGKTYSFDLTFTITSTVLSSIALGFNAQDVFTASNYPVNAYSTTVIPNKTPGAINITWSGNGEELKYSVAGDVTTYYLATPEHLLWFTEEVNGGNANIAASLSADIDLTDTSFDGIGTRENPYTRSFIGGGHTVTYNMDSEDGEPTGFIRSFKGLATAYIADLKVKGNINVTSGSPNVGGIVGEADHSGTMNTLVARCTSEMTINVSDSAGGNIGGIVGYATHSSGASASKSVMDNTHLGTITVAPGASEATTGGIIGRSGDVNLVITGNGNGGSGNAQAATGGGSVTGRSLTGGIAGYIYTSDQYGMGPYNNSNFGVISGEGSGSLGSATGGIFGFVQDNIAFAYSPAMSYGGWYDGFNMNFGKVEGSTLYVGGIAGYLNGPTSSVWYNYNEGVVANSSTEPGAAAGGIIGGATAGLDMTIQNNVNKGSVSASGGATRGGIIGFAENGLDETQAKVKDNYFALSDGVADKPGMTGKNAQNLSPMGYTPGYSGAGGVGTVESPFLLATNEDIIMLAALISDNGALPGSDTPALLAKDAYFKLANDIDMSGYPGFTGIGSGVYPFAGSFDGDGHSVNFALTSTEDKISSMFRYCSGATIKNLTITGEFSGESASALAYSFSGGTVENVTNKAVVTGSKFASGLIMSGWRLTLTNLTNEGTITAVDTEGFGKAAGISLSLLANSQVDGCVNNGDVTSNFEAAGLFGYITNSEAGNPLFVVKNCTNNGRIESKSGVLTDSGAWYSGTNTSYSNTAGGIIGRVQGVEIIVDYCTNNGDIFCSGNNVGGIVGCAQFGETVKTNLTITNSKNTGKVTSTYVGSGDEEYISVGGILGNSVGTFDGREQNTVTVSNNQNTGTVTGPAGSNVSSIVGRTEGIYGNEAGGNNFDFSNGNTTTVINGNDASNSNVGYVEPDPNAPIVPNTPTPSTPGSNSPISINTGTSYTNRPATATEQIDPSDQSRENTLRTEEVTDDETPLDQEQPETDSSLDAGAETIERALESSIFIFVAIGVGVALLGGFVLFRTMKNRSKVA